MEEIILKTEGLKAFYVLDVYGKQKTIKAVNDVDLAIREDEIYGIAGESGCGKSTLLKALAAAVEPPLRVIGGRVCYRIGGEDVDVATLGQEEKRRLRLEYIAYVLQGSMSVLNPSRESSPTSTASEAVTVAERGDGSRQAPSPRMLPTPRRAISCSASPR